ncbi:TPST [Mytilus coruscus]|uniref:Protein-tyrosine sulfotransferase n=1 Tax=Mytilus coruscus TaxID=42192 RepID=A0A6J8BWS7_MYTCO|nr:TPST [Mytilus coruscus]
MKTISGVQCGTDGTLHRYKFRYNTDPGEQTCCDCMMGMKLKKSMCYVVICFISVILICYNFLQCDKKPNMIMVPSEQEKFVYTRQGKAIEYGRESPLIFIGGMPRSGTTLMRAMIDAHPDVRCGEETRIVPRILGMRAQWYKSETEKRRLQEAGISDFVIDSAISAFVLEVIAKHGDAAPRLCNKDPFTLKSSVYLKKLFPNSKFLFMIRDGRATVHSIISRKVTITGFDLTSYRNCLSKWNHAMESMYAQCLHVGARHCLPVYYEQLTLHPELWMKRILRFLEIPWNDTVLHHEDYIGKEISLSKTEKSSDQVIRPVNIDAMSKWVGHLPADVIRDMATIAPMLRILGYDPESNPPNYGAPDPRVADNTMHMHQNEAFWRKKEEELLKSEQRHRKRHTEKS